MPSTRYETIISGTTASIAAGSAATLSLTLAGSNSNADIKKIVIVPTVIGSGELTKVEIYKRSTCLAADRCFATTNFEGNLYAPKFDDGSGPAELNEGWVCDYEDLDATAKLNVKLFNNGPSAKVFAYYFTYQQVGLSSSSTYTPTVTNTTNVTASTPYLSHYARIGNQVLVYWSVDVNATAAAPTATEFQFTLPITSNFADTLQLTGAGNCLTVPAQTSTAFSDAATDRVAIKYVATATGYATHRGSFMYTII